MLVSIYMKPNPVLPFWVGGWPEGFLFFWVFFLGNGNKSGDLSILNIPTERKGNCFF